MTSKPHLCILGLGYIGLPTACLFAHRGFEVTGVDINPLVVDTINQGRLHIEEPGLEAWVASAVAEGRLRAVSKPVRADVYVIAVPTPITPEKHADLSFVQAAARAIAEVIEPGALVVLESTCPPGTTRDMLVPLLTAGGLAVGQSLFLAHCPERVLPGHILHELTDNHRAIGGLTPACTARAMALYQAVVAPDRLHATDATTAEMVKVMENTYRDVNIALANELALISERLGIDAWEAIRLANLHPRVGLHQPGPGVGGHCISVDPWFIVEQAPAEARLIASARRINDEMPHRVVERVSALVPPGSKVALLGAAYKGNVGDTRESPALEVAHGLARKGYAVAIHDPHVQQLEFALFDERGALEGADVVVLLTPHEAFRQLRPEEAARLMRGRLLVDTHNHLNRSAWRNAGFRVATLGCGASSRAAILPLERGKARTISRQRAFS